MVELICDLDQMLTSEIARLDHDIVHCALANVRHGCRHKLSDVFPELPGVVRRRDHVCELRRLFYAPLRPKSYDPLDPNS